MDHKIQTKQLHKIINRLVVPKFNELVDKHNLGEGISVEVKYDGTTEDYIDPYIDEKIVMPVFKILVITHNPVLSFTYLSDGFYVLYNMIGNVVDYIDPSRKCILYFRLVLRSDSGDRLMDQEVLRAYMTKQEPDYDLLNRALVKVEERVYQYGLEDYLKKYPPFYR